MGVLKGWAVADRRILSVRERTSEARAKRTEVECAYGNDDTIQRYKWAVLVLADWRSVLLAIRWQLWVCAAPATPGNKKFPVLMCS